jgi:type VI protein secretion system component VasK
MKVGPLGSLLGRGRLADYAWRAGILIAIGLLVIAKDSRNFALTIAAFCSVWMLVILQALQQRLRRRKLESLMRQRRSE